MVGMIHARTDNMIQSLAKYQHFLKNSLKNAHRDSESTIAGASSTVRYGTVQKYGALVIVGFIVLSRNGMCVFVHSSELWTNLTTFLMLPTQFSTQFFVAE